MNKSDLLMIIAEVLRKLVKINAQEIISHTNIIMKKLALLFVLIGLGSFSIFAQQGTIKGTLIDKKLSEPLMFATVAIKQGTSLITGTQTDLDGNFSIKTDAGIYSVEFSFIGYQTFTVNDIEVKTDEEIVLTAALQEAGIEMAEVVISAKKNRQNANVLLLERKKAGLIIESIGAKQLAAAGASDVADGLKKVPGLSIQGSKFLVVRGLSERYNNSTLNGFAVASPNPDKRVLPYDIFSTSIIDNLSVSKSFNPNFYANFSGASVDIVTRDYPNQRTISLGIGTSMNTQSTFKDFKSDPESANDVLGYNTSRVMPSLITDVYADETGRFRSIGRENQINESNFFTTKFDPTTSTAALNQSYSFNYGDRIISKDNQQKEFGVQFNVNYGNSYNNSFGQLRLINAQGTPLRDFDFNNDTYSTNVSSIANFTYKIGRGNQISFKNLYTHLSDNSVLETWGYYNDIDPNRAYSRRMTYKDYALRTHQLIGEHSFGKSLVNWGASYSKADAAEPDRRQLAFIYSDENRESNEYRINRVDIAETHRFFTDMDDNDASAKAQYKYLFNTDLTKNYITAGVDTRYKFRDFQLRQYNLGLENLSAATTRYDIYGMDEFLGFDAITDDGYIVDEATLPQDAYNANLMIAAPYIFGNYSINNFGFTAGLRAEYANQDINYTINGFSDLQNNITGLDLFPSVITNYNITEDHLLKLSMSRTISRPDFRELAPFEYRESYGSFRTTGNPELQNGYNYNVDLRYEFIPSSNTRAGELIAITAFGKYLNNPIIPTIELGSNPVKSYANAIDGYAIGAELEFRKSLGFITAGFDNLYFNFNSTVLQTSVNVDSSVSNQTSSIRNLIGASPYLINADLTYKYQNEAFNTLLVSISYNTYGRRLAGLGALGAGDIFEMPVNTLNATANYAFGKDNAWSVHLAARNILNAKFITQQELLEAQTDGTYSVIDNVTLNEFTTGVNVSLGLTYTIK